MYIWFRKVDRHGELRDNGFHSHSLRISLVLESILLISCNFGTYLKMQLFILTFSIILGNINLLVRDCFKFT